MRRIFLYTMIVDGQNSWELKRVKMTIFEGYFGKRDKIDGNWLLGRTPQRRDLP